MKFLILNGPNLNLLGKREPGVYGNKTYEDLVKFIQSRATELEVEVECGQTNHEGVLVDWIQASQGNFDGIIINPAAYTHTSIAIMDALQAIDIPQWKCI
jgi:3-dehydroquinate dehydratase-2